MADVLVVLARAAELLDAHRSELDALNVFPVPDADTGTNMAATMRAAVVGSRDADDPLAGAVDAALRGARGNSGVLLSQVVRGLVDAVVARGVLDGPALAEGLAQGSELATLAVQDPVEGTILSVMRAAAEAAGRAAPGGLLVAATAAADAGHAAVARTTDQNEVLARAGVVDAGARGVALLLEALVAVVGGRSPAPPDVWVPDVAPSELADASCVPDDGRWEVMFRLDAPGVAALVREQLAEVGSSVVVVDDGRGAQVHVHTDDIGAVLAVGVVHGVPSEVRVEELADRREPGADGAVLVALVDGQGLADAVRGLGARPLDVDPAAPPTVATVLDHVASVRGAPVVLLVGHADLHDVATRAAAVSAAEGGREILVGRAVSGPAVLSALAIVVDATDAVALEAACASVRTSSVVATPTGWCALVDGVEVADATEPLAALDALLDHVVARAVPEVAQLHIGLEVASAVRGGVDALVEHVRSRWPDVPLDVVAAGQRSSLVQLGVE